MDALDPQDSVLVRIWVREGSEQQTVWRPGFWPAEDFDAEAPQEINTAVLGDSGHPAVCRMPLRKLYTVVELHHGVVRPYREAFLEV